GGRDHSDRWERQPPLVPLVDVARPGTGPFSFAAALPRTWLQRRGRRSAARDTAVRGAHGRRALRRGPPPRHPGALADEQGRAHPRPAAAVALARFSAPIGTPGSGEAGHR